jgi:hypothetical protein
MKEFKEKCLSDEEVAFMLVKLYFTEIARHGFKRKLDLDSIINSYFYALSRIKRKDIELKAIERLVLKEEKELSQEPKEELIPQVKEKNSKKVKGTEVKGKVRGTGD